MSGQHSQTVECEEFTSKVQRTKVAQTIQDSQSQYSMKHSHLTICVKQCTHCWKSLVETIAGDDFTKSFTGDNRRPKHVQN